MTTEFVVRYLLVDADNLLKRSIHPTLKSDGDAGVWNGGLYNAMLSLRRAVMLTRADWVIAVYDDGIPLFRLQLCPYYKQNRDRSIPEKHKEAFKQISQSRELFETLGVLCLSYENLEADDVIAEITRRLSEQGHTSIVASSDRDFYQLVSSSVMVFDWSSKDTVDAADVLGALGVYPDEVVLYKALCGDSSDNLKGAKSVGPKKAADLIRLFREDIAGLPPVDQLSLIVETLADADKQKLESHESSVLGDTARLRNELTVIDLAGSFNYAIYSKQLDADLRSFPDFKYRKMLKVMKKYSLVGLLAEHAAFRSAFTRKKAAQ